MVNDNHNAGCATATGRTCECTGCGGSQHGWQGWLDLTSAEEERRQTRERIEKEFSGTERAFAPPAWRRRVLASDLARLDIVDWLAQPPGPPEDKPAVPCPSAVEQVTILAKEMTRGTWQQIATQLDRATANPRAVKQELANHGWCDLFVAMVQAIETAQGVFRIIPDKAKSIMLAAPTQESRTHVDEAVIDLVVDPVWQAFEAAAFGGVPLLDVLSEDEALRALRVLAVFLCPAPEKHEAVRRHALKPLGDDATKILTDQTTARLAVLFAEWRTDDGS
jgi:hypothetical protein